MRKPLGANRERGVWGGEGTVAPPRDLLEEPAAQFPPNHLLAPSGLRITTVLANLSRRMLSELEKIMPHKNDRCDFPPAVCFFCRRELQGFVGTASCHMYGRTRGAEVGNNQCKDLAGKSRDGLCSFLQR
ncbi:MAG: hypothetical protein HYW48_02655 [Deltaproteobacteria bacterium]|nr:hypothetical protein [Deltaproteobacteria bacterium]